MVTTLNAKRLPDETISARVEGRAVPAVPAVTGQAFELPDGTRVNRAPRDMLSGEIHATYRLAWGQVM